MKQGGIKVFNNKQKLYQMTNLRLNGWAFTSLGVLFDCTRVAVQKQCEKYQIFPINQVITIERVVSNALPKPDPNERRWVKIGNNKVCMGRTYKEYLEREYLHRK